MIEQQRCTRRRKIKVFRYAAFACMVPTTDAYMHAAPTRNAAGERMKSHDDCAVDVVGDASRRKWMARLATKAGGWVLLFPFGPAQAVDDLAAGDQAQRMAFKQRPRAPLSTLLPATEQRMLLKECLSLSESLVAHSSSKDSLQKDAVVLRLESILVNPKQEGGGNYNYYTRGLTEKKRTERDLRILAQYQQTQPRQLSGNIVRAAMNIYISNLRYGSDYTVEDAEWKSSYIRQNGGLPDFRKLIQADLDLRILYMNQVQIRVDDAAAEFYAAVESNDDDLEELRRLLRLADESMDLWFQLIEDVDISEATNAIERGVTIKLADSSYMAGFVPPARD